MIVSSRPKTARRLLAAVGGTVVALGLGGPAQADIKAGVDAWSRGGYATAVHEWEGPAGRGDFDAEFDLGQAYKLGRGVTQDLARAEALFGQAAAQGHLQAADNYGLLMFQRGDHTRAMPYVAGAANRGDPRAQYLMGIAYFNGDVVGKDWPRAYAYENLAQEAGLQQAKVALAQMDKFIPLDQRQQSVALKADLAQQIDHNRNRQMAAVELGGTAPQGTAGPATAPPPPPMAQMAAERSYNSQANSPPAYTPPNPAEPYSGFAAGPAPQSGPQSAMAENTPPPPPTAYARTPAPMASRPTSQAHAMGLPPKPLDLPRKHPHLAQPTLADAQAGAAPVSPQQPVADSSMAPPVKSAASAAPRAASGPWKIQLGAFGVAANADALWAKAKSRPEIAGHPRALLPTGKVNRLLATGYSEQAAHAACTKLTAAGLACLVTKD